MKKYTVAIKLKVYLKSGLCISLFLGGEGGGGEGKGDVNTYLDGLLHCLDTFLF